MNKKAAVVVSLLFLVTTSVKAVDFSGEAGSLGYGSFLLHDTENPLAPTIGVDFGENFIALNVVPVIEHANVHNFFFKLIIKNRLNKNGAAARLRYALNLPLGKTGLWSESALVGGLMEGHYSSQSQYNRFPHFQSMYGASQYLKAVLGNGRQSLFLKAGGFGSGATIYDEYESLAQWDSYGVGVHGLFSQALTEAVKFRLSSDAIRQRYNPDRYFFVNDWAKELTLKSELAVSVGMAEIIPSVNYKKIDLERDRRADLERLEYGGTLILKNAAGTNRHLFAKAIYAPLLNRDGEETLGSVGVSGANLKAEIFQKVSQLEFSNFESKETFWGFKFSWRFPSFKKDILEMDHYGYAHNRKHEFYVDNGLKDDSRLTLEQQAERLGTLRKRNEWSGKNLTWKEAPNDGWGFRDAREVYGERVGDCDEQSCHNAYLDSLNGYKSHQLNWYDLDRWLGHGVQLVQDPTNGQWFLDEYGVLYKVKVDPNAPMEEIGREALIQNSRFTAMPIAIESGYQGYYDEVYYEIMDCDRPGTYRYLTDWIPLERASSKRVRPQVEYGYELFTGRRFLFED